MGVKDILESINPFRIIERIQKNKNNKRIMLLCESNPQNVYAYMGIRGTYIKDVLKALDSLIKDKKKIDINAILSGFINAEYKDKENINKIIKYAINNNLEFDINMIKNDYSCLNDYEIAKYLYDKGGIDAYSFCKIHKPDKNTIQDLVKKDLRCIEWDISNNPKTYEYIIDKIKSDISKRTNDASVNMQQKYATTLSYLDKAKEVIFYRRKKSEGKYYFPESEMYKIIRNFVKGYQEIQNKESILPEDLILLNKPFKAFYERDGFFNEEFGKKIEKIYFDDGSVLGVHNTDGTILKEMENDMQFLNQFFEKGLLYLANSKSVEDNVAIQELDGDPKRSLAELLYWAWDMEGKYNIVFKFPKNILDTKDKDGRSRVIEIKEGDAYIPPKYILGAYDRENPEANIIKNPCFEGDSEKILEGNKDIEN